MEFIQIFKPCLPYFAQPVFGLIRVKLEMITHAYFKGRDFSQVELLKDTYTTLNSSLTECLLQNSHINLGQLMVARMVVMITPYTIPNFVSRSFRSGDAQDVSAQTGRPLQVISSRKKGR